MVLLTPRLFTKVNGATQMKTDTQKAPAANGPQSGLLSRQEAARYLGVTEHTLDVWASLGRYDLPYVKIGRLAKYRRVDLDQFISKRVVGGAK